MTVRYLRSAVAALVILAMVGCGGGEKNTVDSQSDAALDGTPRTGGTLVRRIESECKTLNWVLYTTVYENYIMRHLYDPMIDFNEELEYIPVLAKSWTVSDDHLRITVTLRDDIHWHDGEPITANGQGSGPGGARAQQGRVFQQARPCRSPGRALRSIRVERAIRTVSLCHLAGMADSEAHL